MKDTVDVAFHKLNIIEYPQFPFHPSENYPELGKLSYKLELQRINEVYEAVRDVFLRMGFDEKHYNTPEWNPLGRFVKEGSKVFIKPNQVFHEHKDGIRGIWSMLTHASVLRPIIDYILIATHGKVDIIIGEAPMQGTDFREAVRKSGILDLVNFYKQRNIEIRLIDMRMVIAQRTSNGIVKGRIDNPERKMEDYVTVNLGKHSELSEVLNLSHLLDITDYKKGAVSKHHRIEKLQGGINEYVIPRELLEADLIVNVPKLKTHRKAGMTCACKNLVGIVGDKTCIAHHRRGMRRGVSDEFSKKDYKVYVQSRVWEGLKRNRIGLFLADILIQFFRRYVWKSNSRVTACGENTSLTLAEGNWYGNDTIWRCVKDLNKIVFYADSGGVMRKAKQRNYLCMVDAVWAGEGEGPMEHSCKELGLIFAGCNPIYVDYAAAYFMKFKFEKIPTICKGFQNRWWNLADKKPEEVVMEGNREIEECKMSFRPSYGWRGILEDSTDGVR